MKNNEIAIIDGVKTWRKGTDYFIWIACKKCGKERWVSKRAIARPNYQGRCHQCAGNRNTRGSSYKGRHFTSEGYVLIQLKPDDFFAPICNKSGYVLEHRVVLARQIGRLLQPWEVVHHKNHIRDDNRPENLALQTASDHMRLAMSAIKAELKERNDLMLEYYHRKQSSIHKLARIFNLSYTATWNIINK